MQYYPLIGGRESVCLKHLVGILGKMFLNPAVDTECSSEYEFEVCRLIMALKLIFNSCGPRASCDPDFWSDSHCNF
jgi:hypothetical protein